MNQYTKYYEKDEECLCISKIIDDDCFGKFYDDIKCLADLNSDDAKLVKDELNKIIMIVKNAFMQQGVDEKQIESLENI